MLLLILVVAVLATGREDMLRRIESQINETGVCVLKYPAVEFSAGTARMEGNALILGGQSWVWVKLIPQLGDAGQVAAESVSIEVEPGSPGQLKVTFHQVKSRPRGLHGGTHYLPLPRGKLHQLYLRL